MKVFLTILLALGISCVGAWFWSFGYCFGVKPIFESIGYQLPEIPYLYFLILIYVKKLYVSSKSIKEYEITDSELYKVLMTKIMIKIFTCVIIYMLYLIIF